MKIRSSAPGKLILLGEYAVLEGAPALVMAVNRYAEVTLISSKQWLIDAPAVGIKDLNFDIQGDGKVVFPPSTSEEMINALNFFTATFETAFSFFKQKFNKPPTFRITLDTAQFFTETEKQKLGLGSSAALTVALISALISLGHETISSKNDQKLFKASIQAHRDAQGNIGSGIDVAASVFGGALRYQIVDREFIKPPLLERLTIPGDLYILPIWTGKSASTKQFVQKVESYKIKEPNDFENIVNRMSLISTSGIKAIEQRNISKFMEAIKRYYLEMKNLGERSGVSIVSNAHQEIFQIVTSEGGSYKPSGAGGGDLGIAFFTLSSTKEKISNRVKNAGFQVLHLDLAKKGIQIVTQ